VFDDDADMPGHLRGHRRRRLERVTGADSSTTDFEINIYMRAGDCTAGGAGRWTTTLPGGRNLTRR
jgi:hypothetical protein